MCKNVSFQKKNEIILYKYTIKDYLNKAILPAINLTWNSSDSDVGGNVNILPSTIQEEEVVVVVVLDKVLVEVEGKEDNRLMDIGLTTIWTNTQHAH